ncbi:MAG TPA: hypothetical protein VFL75_01110 [Candidatus Limnocylindria bacterium]|nr:hypothetical protein [Candidatus Limnocylindria bacterium]
MISNRPSRPHGNPPARIGIALAASLLIAFAGLRTALAFHDSTADGALLVVDLPIAHLVVSEVMTGGASASDEFIEIYNPTAGGLPLEGLEVVYVTASGGTVTRKASWSAGAAELPAGAHQLVANSAGVYNASADQAYTGGLAATGGSVAIRIIGAATAIDAVGWGNATSGWLEGTPVAAIAAGHSVERLPGGAAGSGQDTNDNSVDFVDRATPDPQNAGSPPVVLPTPTPTASIGPTPTADVTTSASASPTPAATTTPTATASPTATATPSATPSVTSTASPTATATTSTPVPTPTPAAPLTIAAARALPDGTTVTIEGLALTDSAFTDGGGYVADGTAGIAVLVSGGTFARGSHLRVTGDLDDRFSQRTIRADASGIEPLGGAAEPVPVERGTSAIGEDDEGELVTTSGTLTSGPTVLTTTVAFDVDDGSGPVRVLVGNTSGIELGQWTRGSLVSLRGVVGQRDSSGTGTAGYRLQPRDAGDVGSVAVPTASPTVSAAPSVTPTPSPTGNPDAITIAAARARPFNSRVLVRGVVTLPSNLVDTGTAAIQDATGAIVLRLSDETGALRIGELVEVAGTRATKSGMETLRVVAAPRRLGTQALPDPRRRGTGALGEADEAVLVSIRGAVSTTPRRTSADNVYFDVDDGSGPIRVFVAPDAGVDTERLLSGTQVDVVGVLGQETTGSLPTRGYRLWPRRGADVQVVSQPAGAGGSIDGGGATGPGGSPVGGTGTPAGSGNGAAPGRAVKLPQQARPRLRLAGVAPTPLAEPTTSAPPNHTTESESGTQPLGAGMLLLGGLLFIGSGVTVGGPGLPARLFAWLRGQIDRRRDDEPDDDEADDEEADVDDAPLPVGLPRLVPLPVIEGAESAASRGPRSIHEERERILPPT